MDQPDRTELAEQIAKIADVLQAELRNPGSDPVHSLASARSLRGLTDDAMQALVRAARERGVAWQRIGDALGTTRQAAFQRFGAPIDPRTGVTMERTVLPDAATRGAALLADVAAHRWAQASADFSPPMVAQLGADGLADAYAAVIAMAGELESTGEPEVTAMAGVTVVEVPLHHEAADLVGRVSFGPSGDVVGLWFLPRDDRREVLMAVEMAPVAPTAGTTSSRAVIVFVVVAYASMWLATVPFWLSPRGLALPGATVIIAVAMFGPALASWLACRVDRRPWRRTVGLGPVRSADPARPPRPVRRTLAMLLLAFAAVVLATAVGTALAAALGVVRLDLVGLSGLPALPVALPRGVIVLIVVAQVVIAGFTINAVLALGEELGWRGFLLPALLPLGQFPAVVITGVVWAGWHLPLILLGYEFTGVARPLALLVFTVFCVAAGALLAWFRLRTDSALPGAVAHGTINAIVGLPVVLIAAGQPHHPLLLPPAGLFGSLAFALLAVVLAIRSGAPGRRGSVPRRPGG